MGRIAEQTISDIVFVIDSGAADTDAQTSSGLDEFSLVIDVLHQLLFDGLSVPGAKQTNAGHCCNLPLFLVADLQHKRFLFVLLFIVKHEAVLGESSVHKAIDVDVE